MLTSTLLFAALAAVGLAQDAEAPEARKVYLTSMVDAKFVVTAAGTTAGSALVVYVLRIPRVHRCRHGASMLTCLGSLGRRRAKLPSNTGS